MTVCVPSDLWHLSDSQLAWGLNWIVSSLFLVSCVRLLCNRKPRNSLITRQLLQFACQYKGNELLASSVHSIVIGQFVNQKVVINQFPKLILIILTGELQKDIQTFVCFKCLQSWSMSCTNHQIIQYRFLVLELLKYQTERHVMRRSYGRWTYKCSLYKHHRCTFCYSRGVLLHFQYSLSVQLPYLINYTPRLLVLLIWINYVMGNCFQTQPII